MAAPTFAELQAVRDAVPTTWTPAEQFDDAAVFLTFARTGSVEGTIEALTRRMLTGLLSSPDTFSISGEYSQSNSTAIAALREQLARATKDRIEWEVENEGAAAVRVREVVRENHPGR